MIVREENQYINDVGDGCTMFPFPATEKKMKKRH
jgi:hypothetical protein